MRRYPSTYQIILGNNEYDIFCIKNEREILRDDQILFSESAGRFIITIAPENKEIFEKLFKGLPCSLVGKVLGKNENLKVNGWDGNSITNIAIGKLETAFTQKFGDMI